MPDQASRPSLLTATQDEFIRTLVRAFVALPRALDADLRRDEGLTSSEYVVLTARGRERFLAAWPAHVASLRRHVVDRLDDVELEHCTSALRRIADH